MVDDILLTPEEQDERAKQWLKDNGPALVVGVALGLAAVFGYNKYQDYQKSSAEQASALYEQALTTFQLSSNAVIDDQVATLKSDFAGSSYAAKAVLLKARQLSVGDLDGALAELRWVSEHASEAGIQHTAKIRQAKILIAKGDLIAAKEIASVEPYNGFDSYYHELLGDIAAQQEDYTRAKIHYQTAIDGLGAADAGYSSIISLKMNRLPIATEDKNVVAQ